LCGGWGGTPRTHRRGTGRRRRREGEKDRMNRNGVWWWRLLSRGGNGRRRVLLIFCCANNLLFLRRQKIAHLDSVLTYVYRCEFTGWVVARTWASPLPHGRIFCRNRGRGGRRHTSA
jgi:hypothetical protein